MKLRRSLVLFSLFALVLTAGCEDQRRRTGGGGGGEGEGEGEGSEGEGEGEGSEGEGAEGEGSEGEGEGAEGEGAEGEGAEGEGAEGEGEGSEGEGEGAEGEGEGSEGEGEGAEGEGEGSSFCDPNSGRECDCLGWPGQTGTQICEADGSGWSECFGCPTDPVCVDHDEDGYGEGESCNGPDCNDDDPDINPDEAEVCDNGKDDDCDGETDEDCAPACVDEDGDGYGVGEGCEGPDCNDDNRNVNPGKAEVCDNDRDDDCDGETDEGCVVEGVCVPFDTCVGGCQTQACANNCYRDTTAACRSCFEDSFQTCFGHWCSLEASAWLSCNEEFGCNDWLWQWEGGCAVTRCGNELEALDTCLNTASVTQAEAIQYCNNAEMAWDLNCY
ncbi:MAG: MopE-related protein [Myxococcota bacterium]|jgi:hypothetical protein|nr:MopE-related protein [Myxococcota bacterium]